MSDRKKQFERILRENGFKLERQSGHYVYASPRFAEPIVVACTPSDHRADENAYHELLRVVSGKKADASGRRMPSLMTQVAAAQKIKALPKARKGAASNGTGIAYTVKYVADSPERRAQRAADMAYDEAARAEQVAARTARRDERRFVDGCVEFCCTRVNALLNETITRIEYALRNFDELGELGILIEDTHADLIKKYGTCDDIPYEVLEAWVRNFSWPEDNEKLGHLALDELSDNLHRMDAAARNWETLREVVQADLAAKKGIRGEMRQEVRKLAQWWLDSAKNGIAGFTETTVLEEGQTEGEGDIILQGIILEWHRSMAIVKREPAKKLSGIIYLTSI
jgi:hypothetical protein